MAGGAGERFWPLSRIEKPKHLWNVVGGDKCILELTIERACKIVDKKNIIIITNKEQVKSIKDICRDFPSENIIASTVNIDDVLQKHYPNIEKISIDFSVIEHTDNVWIVPSRFDWTTQARGKRLNAICPKTKTIQIQSVLADIIVKIQKITRYLMRQIKEQRLYQA